MKRRSTLITVLVVRWKMQVGGRTVSSDLILGLELGTWRGVGGTDVANEMISDMSYYVFLTQVKLSPKNVLKCNS